MTYFTRNETLTIKFWAHFSSSASARPAPTRIIVINHQLHNEFPLERVHQQQHDDDDDDTVTTRRLLLLQCGQPQDALKGFNSGTINHYLGN